MYVNEKKNNNFKSKIRWKHPLEIVIGETDGEGSNCPPDVGPSI